MIFGFRVPASPLFAIPHLFLAFDVPGVDASRENVHTCPRNPHSTDCSANKGATTTPNHHQRTTANRKKEEADPSETQANHIANLANPHFIALTTNVDAFEKV